MISNTEGGNHEGDHPFLYQKNCTLTALSYADCFQFCPVDLEESAKALDNDGHTVSPFEPDIHHVPFQAKHILQYQIDTEEFRVQFQ